MKRIYQTIFGDGGDCFRACIASILEVEIQELPNFCSWKKETWFQQTAQWLDSEFYCILLRVGIGEEMTYCGQDLAIHDFDPNEPDRYVLQDVKTPRGRLHSIISRYHYDGIVVSLTPVHDPHPDGGEVWPEHKNMLTFYQLIGAGVIP